MALCGVIALTQCASDPGTAQSGQMIWNTTTNDVKIYDGTSNNAWWIWQPAQPPDNAIIQISGTTYATGGNIVCCGSNYVCHLFYTSGTLNWTIPNFQIDNVHLFGVGGGGGGGHNVGGGGGGGAPSILGSNPSPSSFVLFGCIAPCDWRGPYCWDTTNWVTPTTGPSITVTVGGGGAGASSGNGTDGGNSYVCLIHSSAPGASFACGSTNANPSVLNRCGGSVSSGCQAGEAAQICSHGGGGGAGGSNGWTPRNGGAAGCCLAPLGTGQSTPGYYPNGGLGNKCRDPGQKRTSGGGGNYGADQGARSCLLLDGGAGNGDPQQYLVGGTGSCGYTPPHTPWICAGGGGAGSSHMGNTNCDGGAPQACNNALRTCVNNGDVGGCGGTGDFPIQTYNTRNGGNACTISAPYPTSGGWVGGGGGGSGYNGSGGNGSSGMIIIRYPCVFT